MSCRLIKTTVGGYYGMCEWGMKYGLYISLACLLLLSSCSVKKNNIFSRNYHQMTTRYNVYFNGDQAFKSGLKNMETRHKEDYTNLLPVFVSNNEQTRGACSSDMDYAIEKAAKAIDKHSITVKPKRKKNKDSKNYETFRKKKEFNKQLDKCYMLLGKAYFYKKKYAMANNTFRFIQRQYAEDDEVMAEASLWLFRSLTEMGRYDEARKFMNQLAETKMNRKEREMLVAAQTDFYVRQGMYLQAISAGEQLANMTKSMKRKPRYNFMLSQLYLKENQDAQAMYALKKTVRFNFNYEMVFNAKINMALAYQSGDGSVVKRLNKMLRDAKNVEYKDRIYYALGNIEEKQGNEKEAIDLYWKSVRSSVDNDNQQALSFYKLGDYYFRNRDYVTAQTCYDSCMFMIDSRYEDYDKIRTLVTDLTNLVVNLRIMQQQDSLLQMAALPESERNRLIDDKIEKIKEKENQEKEAARKEQAERNFYDRNNMINRGDSYSQGGSGEGDWYFYNPMTVSLGKNEFKRKWGRRKLEDNWRRQNKAMVDFVEQTDEIAGNTEEKEEKSDVKSRDYYLKNLPVDKEAREVSEKKVENACYKAGEIYMYRFNDHEKALECFKTFTERFTQSNNLPMVYYMAYAAAEKLGNVAEAQRYKNELITKFPDSDFARGLQDPDYFKKVDGELKVIERMYEEAYIKYRQVYYADALAICDDILKRYPDNKLNTKVLFLKAMCVVNTHSVEEAREALNRVVAAKPDKEVQDVVSALLASLSVGEKPALYTENEMAQARALKANRNWVFDEKGNIEGEKEKNLVYKMEKDKEHIVVLLMPEDFSFVQETKLKARLVFVNASEAVEGKSYEIKKEDLWYKKAVLEIQKFADYKEAGEYLNRIATDKSVLKTIGEKGYRVFAITPDNLAVLKRLKNIDDYVDFFTENYFENKNQGDIITGKRGTIAHIFNYEENETHHFMLLVPFRQVNTKRIAEALHNAEPAFTMIKEEYDDENEFIVVRKVGTKVQALDYMNAILKNKDIFDKLAGINYQAFVITESNRKILLESGYLDEYVTFFNENYLKSAASVGVEDGDFIFNKELSHKFVLLYSNKVDPFKLKEVFAEFNFAGLTTNNLKFNEEYDYMVVSGFNNKDEAMRYFTTVVNNRKLFKPLKNTDYTNFIITDLNLQVMEEKQSVEKYLEFFKKYYMR